MEQKKYIIYGGAAIIIFALGLAVGSVVANKGGVNTAGSLNTFQAGWDAAKKRLTETGYAFPTAPETRIVSGIVSNVQADGMTVKIRPLEALADPALDTRTVKFNADTKFYQIDQKDPVKYQDEVKAFTLKSKTASPTQLAAPGNFPQAFTKSTVTAQAIKSGANVTVSAATNIKDQKEFIATEVTIQGAPTSAVSPAVAP